MSGKDALSDLKRAKEEEYFRNKERELVEKIRRRVAQEAERQSLANITGTTDEEILTTLQEMGYTRETVRLLYLVPLVEVAWASGSVTSDEREIILEASRLVGVREGSRVHQQLVSWLDERPSEEFFAQTLGVIDRLVQMLPKEKQKSGRNSLVHFCTNVASASGGILGFGNRISSDELAVIERIAAELESRHQEAAKQIIEAAERFSGDQ
ncbi:MAG TPA: hypothetical protein VJH03_14935 [Blastocatellia bacterium]|nr:hypothetical protein [Blastocatellia bacterium]